MSSNVGSDSTFRDAFLYGAARAFFVTAYADFVEDAEREDDGHDYPSASHGEDWNDIAPEAPPNAYALAGELWQGLHAMNGEAGVYSLALRAESADGVVPDPEDFGFSFAMQAMGHGVSWFDNHKSFPVKVPHVECSMFSFSEDAYRDE